MRWVCVLKAGDINRLSKHIRKADSVTGRGIELDLLERMTEGRSFNKLLNVLNNTFCPLYVELVKPKFPQTLH